MTPRRIVAVVSVVAAAALGAACSDGSGSARDAGESATSPAASPTAAASDRTPTSTSRPRTTTTTPRSSVPRATTTTAAATTTTVPQGPTYPLTGLPLDNEATGYRAALVVEIDNHPQARPQSGLNLADVVFEENVEQLTRFAAVFHSADADPVGPIRSGARRTSTCWGRSTGRCSCGAAATPT